MQTKNSFTVIELLIVIAAIGMIASIILVRVQDAREKARIASGLNFSQSLKNSLGIEAAGIWKCDEGQGSLIYDSSGYHNNGIINGAQFTDNTPHQIVGTGKGKYALTFEGSDNVEIDNLPVDTEKGAYTTVEFWMYWKGNNNEMPMGWQQPYDLWLVDGCFGFNTGQNNVLGVSWENLANRWVHIAAIFYNGKPTFDTVSLYINGLETKIYECQGTTNASRRVTPKLYFSGWGQNSSYRFNGLMDELQIYNKALTTGQIQEHYLAGLKKHLSYK